MVPDQWVAQLIAELLAISECGDVVIVTREPTAARSRVRNTVLDVGAADFAERTAALAREGLSHGPVNAVRYLGSRSMRWYFSALYAPAHLWHESHSACLAHALSPAE